ncbi:tetraacyldisaccharide 4'-kinase [Psychrobacter sp.]|uniref:tetraacyldisaccharide 4'-kinase n=1 Tax=Psychrobacter sp. TaxID=56811 RepID=UPI0025D6968E|nr:tetraacyldisaccharide 4'-kinase [Psychrobacter sp.]
MKQIDQTSTSTNKKNSNNFNLELAIVKAWQKQAGWLWLLWPFSFLYGIINGIRSKLFRQGILSSYRAPVAVMVVGNITVGGSGKTPLIIELVRYLKNKGIKVGVISRGYGGDESLMPQIVTVNSKPQEVGDEPCLIIRETGAVVAVCPNRQQAIETLLNQHSDIQLIIADDGLQHYKLQRDIEWVVVDSARGFGNKQLLPTGFLREPISRLKDSTVIYHEPYDKSKTALKVDNNKLTMHLQAEALQPLIAKKLSVISTNTETNTETNTATNLATKSVYAISGIGYPQRFFNTLKDLGYEVEGIAKPDHHQFNAEDLMYLTDKPIVITSKDAVKIAPLVSNNPKLQNLSIWVLPVKAVLSDNAYHTLTKQLSSLGIVL